MFERGKMKNSLKQILLILFTFLVLFILTGCNNDNKEGLLDEKVYNEIAYLDSKIVSMINSINNISFQNYRVSTEEIKLDKDSGQSGEQATTSQEPGQKDKGEQGESQEEGSKSEMVNKSEMSYSSILNGQNSEVNWDLIRSDIEVLHSTWNTIVLDLNKKNINDEKITSFGKELDNTTIQIKDEKKTESISGLARMYSYVPEFLKDMNKEADVKYVKALIINAYSLAEQEKWDEIAYQMSEAISKYNDLVRDANNSNQNSFNINKTRVAIKEMQNSVTLKNKELFYIKYRNAIEQLGLI